MGQGLSPRYCSTRLQLQAAEEREGGGGMRSGNGIMRAVPSGTACCESVQTSLWNGSND